MLKIIDRKKQIFKTQQVNGTRDGGRGGEAAQAPQAGRVGSADGWSLPLLQGEYIAPEKIENTYGRSMFVAQAFLYGNSYKVCEAAILLQLVSDHMMSCDSSLQPCVLAVIVPDEEYLQMWAAKQGLKGDMEELCANKVGKADRHTYIL